MNAIDGVGGLGIGEGAPEIVTGSRDGKPLHSISVDTMCITVNIRVMILVRVVLYC